MEGCKWRQGKTMELIMWFWPVFQGFLVQGSHLWPRQAAACTHSCLVRVSQQAPGQI